MIDWAFPSNGGGQIRGIADAGIATFTGKEISSLARETCQNSLDATRDENLPVKVEFHRHDVDTEKIPACSTYKNILRKCRDYWQQTDKAKNFFDAALSQLNRQKISVLRVSDFNTTGLDEPFNPRAMTGWNALTKIDGGATKSGEAAGSFGIGKNAPFTNSYLRLIFYRTMNLHGERAAQGMARLVSFELDAENISSGVGYYGDTNQNQPVSSIAALDKIFQRTEIGTDLFVYAFNGQIDWSGEIIRELIQNFIVAIYRDKLRVKVQGITLDKNTLGELIAKHEEKISHASNYYKILSGDGAIKIFEDDFYGMGKIKLRVLHDQRALLNRKVLIVRKTGMKLFEMANFPRGISFTAILELEGVELNTFFREMETPTHDKWVAGRYEANPKLAEHYLKELRRWIREKISNLGADDVADEVNVEGLSHMLDFDDDAIDSGNVNEFETLDNPATPEFELEPVTLSTKTFSSSGGNDNSKTQRTFGDVTDAGDINAIRTLSGLRKRKTLTNHTGEKNPDGKDIILEPVGQKISYGKVRVIKVGEKNYRLILKVAQNISGGRIEIFSVGEDGSREKLFITRAIAEDYNSKILTVGEKISFQNLRGNTDAKIIFELRDARNYTLGVNVYED